MKALLLIDLQNDFMPGGALGVPNGFDCIKAAQIAMEYFDHIIASKDWHPLDHLSFAEQHEGRKPGDMIELAGINQTLWPTHCVQNTHGSDLVSQLDQTRIKHLITKGENQEVDSYSAFFDNARRHETGLRVYLENNKINELFILGLATEYCLKYSVLDAISLGIKTHVLIDGCRGIGLQPKDIPNAISEMKHKGARLINLSDLNTMRDLGHL